MIKLAKTVILKNPKWPMPKVFIEINGKKAKIEMCVDDFINTVCAEIGQPIKYQTKKGLSKALLAATEKIIAEMRETPLKAVEEKNA